MVPTLHMAKATSTRMTSQVWPSTPDRFGRREGEAMRLSSRLVRSLVPSCAALLILFLRDFIPYEPHVRHVIDRPIAKAYPVARVGIVLIRGGVVVPRHDVQDGSCRKDWCDLVCIGVRSQPLEIEPIDATEHLGLYAA